MLTFVVWLSVGDGLIILSYWLCSALRFFLLYWNSSVVRSRRVASRQMGSINWHLRVKILSIYSFVIAFTVFECLRLNNLLFLWFPALPLGFPFNFVLVNFKFHLVDLEFIWLVFWLERVNQVVPQLVDVFKVLQLNLALLKQTFLFLQFLQQLRLGVAQRRVAFLKSIKFFAHLLQFIFLPCIIQLGEFILQVLNDLVLFSDTISLGFDQTAEVLGVLEQLLLAFFPVILLLPEESQVASQLLVSLLQLCFVFFLSLKGFLKTLDFSHDFVYESLQVLVLSVLLFFSSDSVVFYKWG